LPNLPRQATHLVLDNLRSAFNVGSIFRTADAAAVERIHLCGMSAHPPHRKLEKTALGAADYVAWTYHERTSDAISGLRTEGVVCVAIEVAEHAVPMDAFDWPTPVALVFGNEVTGINERTLAKCDAVVQIPMHGFKNTINVATAVGIVLYHLLGANRRDPTG
jgi:tRNA G18 (ribose-2'-O)-methylase SpoU